MKLKPYYLLTILFSLNLLSNEKDIKENIEKILPPEAKIESIEKSIFPGIYKVFYGDLQPLYVSCLLYTSPSPRDATLSRMPSSA